MSQSLTKTKQEFTLKTRCNEVPSCIVFLKRAFKTEVLQGQNYPPTQGLISYVGLCIKSHVWASFGTTKLNQRKSASACLVTQWFQFWIIDSWIPSRKWGSSLCFQWGLFHSALYPLYITIHPCIRQTFPGIVEPGSVLGVKMEQRPPQSPLLPGALSRGLHCA